MCRHLQVWRLFLHLFSFSQFLYSAPAAFPLRSSLSTPFFPLLPAPLLRLCVSLRASACLCVPLRPSASLCVPLRSSAFLCVPLRSSAFLYPSISMHPPCVSLQPRHSVSPVSPLCPLFLFSFLQTNNIINALQLHPASTPATILKLL